MFNIGGGEFLVIAVIALIVLGPQRLPEAARQVGKVMGDLRRLSSGFQNELKGALEESERAAETGPRRDVLAAAATDDAEPPATPGAPTLNGSEPSQVGPARPRRRTPLRAEPAEDDESPSSPAP